MTDITTHISIDIITGAIVLFTVIVSGSRAYQSIVDAIKLLTSEQLRTRDKLQDIDDRLRRLEQRERRRERRGRGGTNVNQSARA